MGICTIFQNFKVSVPLIAECICHGFFTGLSSSKRSHHFLNGGWLPGYIEYMNIWYVLLYKFITFRWQDLLVPLREVASSWPSLLPSDALCLWLGARFWRFHLLSWRMRIRGGPGIPRGGNRAKLLHQLVRDSFHQWSITDISVNLQSTCDASWKHQVKRFWNSVAVGSERDCN